jgi:hypothetical protein
VFPLPNNDCSTVRLASRPHALRPCARQPRGCHFNWLEPIVLLDKVQHEIIRFSRSHAPRAFALTHAGDSSICNHRCPHCCDTRSETPSLSRSSSSPRSPSSTCAGSPRRTFSATAAPINTHWRHQGLDPKYHTFAVVLQSNYVSPHQVLLDADIDAFCCWERTGIFLRRTLHVEGCCFASIFLCSFFLSLRGASTSFRYQMVCSIYLEIIIPLLYLLSRRRFGDGSRTGEGHGTRVSCSIKGDGFE